MKQMLEERQFPEEYTSNLFNIQETTTNIDINSEYTAFPVENKDLFSKGLTTIVPIPWWSRTFRYVNFGLSVEDHLKMMICYLVKMARLVVGMEILHQKSEEIEEEARSKAELFKWPPIPYHIVN